MKIFEFKKEPNFAELWDICVYNLFYNLADYLKEIKGLFSKIGISKQSKIIDVSAGGGFPAVDLIKEGYAIDCFDATQDQIDVFAQKVKNLNLVVDYKKGFWEDIPKIYLAGSYDFLFCRGNSFIYADRGWNQEIAIDSQKSLSKFREILKIFYNLLKPGGFIYLDKFKDSEIKSREAVAKIKVKDGDEEDLIFWTERYPEKKIRRATMLRRDKFGKEGGLPNVTYDLSGRELEEMMRGVGFKNIKILDIKAERHFTVWLAQK